MPKASTVSIVMSFQDSAATLSRAVKSLLWQTFTDWELIAINDGSRDSSVEILQSFADSRIMVAGGDRRMGLPARLNQGVALSQGRFVARMDADDVSFPKRLESQYRYMLENPGVDLVAASSIAFAEDLRPIRLMPTLAIHAELVRRPWHGFAMPHPTWFGRRDWFLANPYDEKCLKSQDQNLLYRTYRHSTFGGIVAPLLGYYQPGISVMKRLKSRGYLLQGLRQSGNVAHLVGGVLTHSVAAMRDLAYVGAGVGFLGQADPKFLEAKTEWSHLVEMLGK